MKTKRVRWYSLLAVAAICLGAAGIWRAGAAPRETNPPVRFAVAETGLEQLRDLSDAYVHVADTVRPAVVKITVIQGPPPQRSRMDSEQEQQMREFLERFFGPGFGGPGERAIPFQQEEPERQGVGSGFVVDAENGYILTNNHVVENAREIDVQLTDKREFDAKLIGADPSSDVAVVKIDAGDLTAVPLGDSNSLRVGEIVLAVGSPFSLGGTVTQGIVSATGRTPGILNQGNLEKSGFENFIQTDAAVNVGNSGGPLVNLKGEVVGINSAIATSTGLFSGVSFAVPIDMARDVMQDFVKEGRVIRGYLGVEIGEVSPAGAKYNKLDKPYGAEVSKVTDDSPAAKAGLKSDDIILELNGQEVVSPNWFVIQVSSLNPGDKIELGILREGARKTVTVTLTERPSDEELFGTTEEKTTSAAGKSEPENESVAAESLGLAVRTLTDQVAEEMSIDKGEGVVITEVKRMSAAYRNGLETGMTITEVDGQAVHTAQQFKELVADGLKKRGIVKMRVITDQGLRPVYLEPLKAEEE